MYYIGSITSYNYNCQGNNLQTEELRCIYTRCGERHSVQCPVVIHACNGNVRVCGDSNCCWPLG